MAQKKWQTILLILKNDTLSTWLRKSSAPEGIKVIKMNVTGDSRINTSDALGIMEYYVNGKEFSILNN